MTRNAFHNAGMLIGYARVSTIKQNLDRQLVALKDAGCEKIFSEKVSGKSLRGRPKLEAAIAMLQEGDVLVVAEWDRATRSMHDGMSIIQRIAVKKAAIKALDKTYLDLTTAIGQGILSLLSSFAQDERERIVRRATEGRAQAKEKGVKFGPKFKLDATQKERALQLIAEGKSLRYIGGLLGVSAPTISRLR